MAVSCLRGWAWYLLITMITVQWLSLLTKAFRWDTSVVSSCSFEKRFVNCHFELNIQYWQQPGISGRPITSPVFTHPVVSEPCSLCSEAIHSSYTKWKPIWVYDLLAIFNICWYRENMQFWHIMLRKKWSPAGLRYLGSAVALLHFSSHWLPGDREFRALNIIRFKFYMILFFKGFVKAKSLFVQVMPNRHQAITSTIDKLVHVNTSPGLMNKEVK